MLRNLWSRLLEGCAEHSGPALNVKGARRQRDLGSLAGFLAHGECFCIGEGTWQPGGSPAGLPNPLSLRPEPAMPNARIAGHADLTPLLALFEASEVSRHVEPRERAEQIWAQTLARDGLLVFVSNADSAIVSTCMLITVPNLLRGGRQHGIIENVATHPAYQGRGHGGAVIGAALAEAWRQDCHHVLLQSGRADPRVRRFYEKCGFKPGLRTAYAAHRPA
jgi:GNAT superfamily N-acetyltransferase